MEKVSAASPRGFTLIEILVSLALAGIVVSAMLGVYITSSRQSVVQDQAIVMEQNLRAGMRFLTSELKMAGYNPAAIEAGLSAPNEQPAIMAADATGIYYIKDDNGNGATDDLGDHVVFRFYDGSSLGYQEGTDSADGDGDGFPDFADTLDAVAEQLEGVEFFYQLDDGTQVLNPAAAQRAEIVAVQVTLVARTAWEDPRFVNETTFTGPGGTVFYDPTTATDGFRRRMLSTLVKLRNLAI
ncbi:hypothetical protein DESUT3_40770 [Desulfuromonas versatilis]|uniref:Prepilin-type N-terminal cleavage/methylation domain-containing protein n=1 Tax=Desulfuromonas versatilis TaxID=2802975 RepID=A0ABN6E3T4_9BACT|nr:PilW family protein [Desulfuromonas versatilis]BCR07008.1 hypothetical protein DESUT3_40770 [Desulfuromonas versatilis]